MLLELLFNSLIRDKLVSLFILNSRIQNFSFPKEELSEIPPKIEPAHLCDGGSMKLTAQKAKVLATRLPAMVGELIPKDYIYWKNFILILQIYSLVVSPIASTEMVFLLEGLVSEFLVTFLNCYGDARFPPKLHYLIHLPLQIWRFGPGRQHSCKRWERQFALLKQKKFKNFKNIAKSIAFDREIWHTYAMSSAAGGRSENFLYAGDQVQSGCKVRLDALQFDFVKCYLKSQFNIDVTQNFAFAPREVMLHGLSYRNDSILLLRFRDDMPVFAMIQSIFIVESVKFFKLKKLKTFLYSSHFNAYSVEETEEVILMPYLQLFYKWPQHSFRVQEVVYVTLYGCDKL